MKRVVLVCAVIAILAIVFAIQFFIKDSGRSIEEGNLKLAQCYLITDLVPRGLCLDAVFAGAESYSYCAEINQTYAWNCYEYFAVEKEKPELCENVQGYNGENKDEAVGYCYRSVALALKDESICMLISNETLAVGGNNNMRDDCIRAVRQYS